MTVFASIILEAVSVAGLGMVLAWVLSRGHPPNRGCRDPRPDRGGAGPRGLGPGSRHRPGRDGVAGALAGVPPPSKPTAIRWLKTWCPSPESERAGSFCRPQRPCANPSLSLVGGACPLSEEPVPCRRSLSLVGGACPLSEEPVPCRKSLSLVGRACPLSEEPVPCRKSLSLVGRACPWGETAENQSKEWTGGRGYR
jgi:hypothetical protein